MQRRQPIHLHRLRKALPALQLVLLAITVAASALPGTSARAEPHLGGVLKIAVETDAWGFDPIKARGLAGAGRIAASMVMECLFEQDPDGGLTPVLAESAVASADGKIWTVTLRRGIQFHDGTPFDADAVVQHWGRILDPNNRFRGRVVLRPLQAVERAGDYAVRFLLHHPWPAFLSTLANSRGFEALIPSPAAVAAGSHHLHPVGTGPFRFQEWQSRDHLTVVRNPTYHREGRPYLDAVVIRPIPDHESRNAAFTSGQVDVLATDRPKHVLQLARDPNYRELSSAGAGVSILAMNTTRPPLDDPRVRRALAHAWDQEKYLKVSFRNIMPFAEHWYGDMVSCGEVGYRAPDPERARQLLAEYGQPIELEYVHTATQRGREAAEIVQQLFGAVGVVVRPVPLDPGGIVKRLFSKDFELASWVLVPTHDMGPITVAALHSESPWNITRYRDPEMDRLLTLQNTTGDPVLREQTLCEIARKVNRDAPFLYLYGQHSYVFTTPLVHGIPPPKNWDIRLAGAWVTP